VALNDPVAAMRVSRDRLKTEVHALLWSKAPGHSCSCNA
jgi:hypothetical protein